MQLTPSHIRTSLFVQRSHTFIPSDIDLHVGTVRRRMTQFVWNYKARLGGQLACTTACGQDSDVEVLYNAKLLFLVQWCALALTPESLPLIVWWIHNSWISTSVIHRRLCSVYVEVDLCTASFTRKTEGGGGERGKKWKWGEGRFS